MDVAPLQAGLFHGTHQQVSDAGTVHLDAEEVALGLGLVLYFDRLFYDVRAREQLIEEGEQAVRAQMKDVSSATFNNIHLSKSGKGVCGHVKGYISLGAYDGRFIYSGNGAAYLENDDNGDGFKKVWASSCQ